MDGLNQTFVCVHKQKTRLARILAVKSGGANAYLQYKQSRLLIELDEEVTTDTQPSPGGSGVFDAFRFFFRVFLRPRRAVAGHAAGCCMLDA